MIKPGDIAIKNTQVLRAIMECNYAPLLITINCEVADKFGLFITEAWREPLHDGDVHNTKPGRATDLRVRVYGNMEKAKQIERWINNKWEYDFKRPKMKVAIIHRVEGGSLHFHLQASINTRLRPLCL